VNEVKKLVGFVLAGGSATVLNYGVFAGLYILGLNYLVASAIGYVSGIAISYSINRFLVFKKSERRRNQLSRYVLTYLLALVAQMLLLQTGVYLGVDPLLSNALAIILVLLVNFVVVRKVVFGDEKL
jgi:putative flippase GtrA